MSAVRLAHRRAWSLFLGSAATLVIAMAILSIAILRGESRAIASSSVARHAARLSAAATAMDRWFGPVLAREAGRHHSDYASYRAPRRAFSAGLERLPPGSVLEPSPLLGFSADTILLHVEWTPESGPRSPEAPSGRERELALASGLPAQFVRVAEDRLQGLASQVDLAELARWVREQAPATPVPDPKTIDQASCLAPDELWEGPLGAGLVEDAGGASVGPLVARWYGGEGLLFARDVRVGQRGSVQVVVADWPALSSRLLQECASDIAGARLVRNDYVDGRGVALSTLPAVLDADPPPPPVMAWTPQRTRLALAWVAGLISLGAIAWALRASLVHAERRARFAAAVSHELRTPLTTLRMYSEMLADGLVTDPAARQQYLETIQAESARLASLVENVLLHARIERTADEGRRRMTVGHLVESVAPALRRRADAAGRPLVVEIDIDREAEVEVDRDAVERVLFNLIDNACKHGAEASDKTLRLEVRRRASLVDLQVRDDGPGIPRALGTAVFEAFRRGEETGAPGAGLGLALSRSLAREMRGELSLVPSDRGACFRLSLRVV